MSALHKEIVELIPWYANGTLPAEEHAGVRRHLNECLPCRAALREAQHIRGLVTSQDDLPLSAEHGVSDLLRRIDGAARGARLRFTPVLAYGTAVFCAAIAAWFLVPVLLTPQASDLSGPFTTLTDDASGGPRIDIVFSDATAEAEILEIIESVGASIVGGPSELGRYTVTVPGVSEDELAGLIERLSGDPRVRFAGRNYIATPSAAEDAR